MHANRFFQFRHLYDFQVIQTAIDAIDLGGEINVYAPYFVCQTIRANG